MAIQDLANLSNVLLEAYTPKIVDQVERASVIQGLIERNETDIVMASGRSLYGYIPVLTGTNQGIGARAVQGALPTAQRRTYSRMYVPLTYQYGSIQIEGQAQVAADGGKNALVDIVDEEVKGLIKDLKKDLGRQYVGDGTGALCQISAIDNVTVTVLDDEDSPGTSHLEPGMVIDSYTAKTGGAQGINSVTIASVDSRTQFTTSTTAAAGSANDYVFREDSRGYEIVGLLGHIDDGNVLATWQGITRSATPWAKANVLENSNTTRSLTEALLIEAIDKATTNEGKPSIAYGSYATRSQWYNLYRPDVRFQAETKKLKGGFTGLSFVGVGSTK